MADDRKTWGDIVKRLQPAQSKAVTKAAAAPERERPRRRYPDRRRNEMDAYAAWPAEGGPFPVIMFMDIWGLRELFALTRKVASHGYYCIVPNLYYRSGGIRIERRNAAGRMVSFDTLPRDLQQEMLVLGRGLTRQMIETDVSSIFDFARTQPVSAGPAGTVGLCLGGRIGFFAAQSFPDRIWRDLQLPWHASGHRCAARRIA